jgi:hypothetical protein
MSLADDYKNYPIVLLIEREKLNKYHDFFEHFLFFVLVIFFFFFFETGSCSAAQADLELTM